MTYQLTNTDVIIRHNDNGTNSYIPSDPRNADRIIYQAWLDLGNTPEAA